MKRIVFLMLAVALAVSFALVPAVAGAAPTTEVVVATGAHAPQILAAWEQDQSGCLEDADCPSHSQFGTQVNPPLVWGEATCIDYFAVVYDEYMYTSSLQVDTWAKVFWPAVEGYCAGEATPWTKMTALRCGEGSPTPYDAFSAAARANLVWYDGDWGAQSVALEIAQCTTVRVFHVQICLPWCEDPAGDYSVIFEADDLDSGTATFENYWTYEEAAGLAWDFSGVDYGTIAMTGDRSWKDINGDFVWAEQQAENGASVRNIGNVDCMVNIMQDDMAFGTYDDGSGNIVSAVKFRARVVPCDFDPNNMPSFSTYDPGEWQQLAAELPWCCGAAKLDLSIKVLKDPYGTPTHVGTIWLSASNAGVDACLE